MREFNSEYTGRNGAKEAMYWNEIYQVAIADNMLNPLEAETPALATFKRLENLVKRVQQRFNNPETVLEASETIEEEGAFLGSLGGLMKAHTSGFTLREKGGLINDYLTKVSNFYKEEHELCEKLSLVRTDDIQREALFAEANITSPQDKEEYMKATHALILSRNENSVESNQQLSTFLAEHQVEIKAAADALRIARIEKQQVIARDRANPDSVAPNRMVTVGLLSNEDIRHFSYTELVIYENNLGRGENMANIFRNAKELGLIQVLGSVKDDQITGLLQFNDITSWATSRERMEGEPEVLYTQRMEAQRDVLQGIQGVYNDTTRPQLGEMPEAKILKTLISQNATELYPSVIQVHKHGYMKPEDLEGCTEEKIRALTNSNSLDAYRAKVLNFSDLKKMEPDEITKLTNEYAINVVINTKKLQLLDSPEAIKIYSSNKGTRENLQKLSYQEIELLISPRAVATYSAGSASVSDLQNLDRDKFEMLTSPEALATYSAGRAKVSDLQNLDRDKFEILTSPEAIAAYKTKSVKVSDFENYSGEQIKALMRPDAIEVYRTNNVKASDFRGCTEAQITLLTSKKALAAYRSGRVNVSDLKNCTEAEFALLTSRGALDVYNMGVAKAYDLSNCPEAKMALLISPGAIAAYKTKSVNPSDLKCHTEDVIKALISPEAIEAYKTYRVQPSDFRGCTEDKIKALTSPEAVTAYKTRSVGVVDLKNCDEAQIKALTSPEALAAYEARYIKIGDINMLDIAKIQALTSHDAIKTYETKCATVTTLKVCDADKIRTLTSPEARAYYKNKDMPAKGMLNVADLDSSTAEILSKAATKAAAASQGKLLLENGGELASSSTTDTKTASAIEQGQVLSRHGGKPLVDSVSTQPVRRGSQDNTPGDRVV